MSLPRQEPKAVESRLIDRLVDGELSDAERSALLQRLETEEDGWRRCALAFLEAQAWREALSTPIAPSSPETIARTPGRGDRTVRGGLRRSMPWRLAVAAGFVAAFLSGWCVGGASRLTTPRRDMPAPVLARDLRGDEHPEAVGISAREDESSSTEIAEQALDTQPVFDRRWLSKLPTPLSAPVLRQLQRYGYQVEQSQSLVSLGLEDGQQLAVPVDEVKLRFVGDRTY